MSGKKAYHVDMSAWFRRQIRDRVRALLEPGLLEGVRAETRAELQGDLDRMRSRQDRVDATVRRLGEQARHVEERTNQRLREHMAGVDERLQQQRDGFGAQLGEVRAQVAEQERALRADLDAARAEARRETAQLRLEVQQDKQRAAAAAAAWLDDARAMRDLIVDGLPHERYAPGALARLEQHLDTARTTLEQGHAEAALAGGQSAFHELSDLRVDLELKHREWTLLRAAALEALATVRRSADERAHRSMRAPDGRELVGSVGEVDHWARGELGVLRAKLADAEQAVRSADSPMSIDDLRRVVETSAPEYSRRLDDLVEEAEQRLIASQLRVNVAQEVVDTLDRVGGYLFVSGHYVGGDFREAYYTRLDLPNSESTIVVEVAPGQDGPLGSTVRILSYDDDTGSEDLRHARARDVTAALRGAGLAVPDPVAEPGKPDPKYIQIASGPAGETPGEVPVAGPRTG
jgi:hypothetical protein